MFAQEKILAFLNFCREPEQEGSVSKFATKFPQTLERKDSEQFNIT